MREPSGDLASEFALLLANIFAWCALMRAPAVARDESPIAVRDVLALASILSYQLTALSKAEHRHSVLNQVPSFASPGLLVLCVLLTVACTMLNYDSWKAVARVDARAADKQT